MHDSMNLLGFFAERQINPICALRGKDIGVVNAFYPSETPRFLYVTVLGATAEGKMADLEGGTTVRVGS